jgi:hypothetical protein
MEKIEYRVVIKFFVKEGLDLKMNDYRDGIIALDHRWNKFFILKGCYFEK